MRAPLSLRLVLLAVAAAAAVAACVGSSVDPAEFDGDTNQAPGPSACAEDTDCVLAASTCCGCPTFAVTSDDPLARACSNVECPDAQCESDVIARCNEDRRCELACAPRACEPAGPACPYGFAADANGCLTCACAAPAPGGCTNDNQCTRTRADCCGCTTGGADTAVLTSAQMSYDDMLECPSSPACPGINTCTSDEPTCVQGRCELVSPALPAGACGRADLPPCPAGTVCLVNVNDQANMHGVGVCGEPR